MNIIIPVTGNTAYEITLDPSVWIFDDRKISFTDFFQKGVRDALEPQTDQVQSGQIGIREGAAAPPVQKSVRRYKKKDWFNESFVIPAKFFIENAEPNTDAQTVTFTLENGDNADVTLDDAKNGVFAFSEDGKAIKENGPIHFYHGDGSNIDTPLKGIRKIILK